MRIIVLFVMAAVLFSACNQPKKSKYLTDPNGYEYAFHKDEATENVKMGDYVEVDMINSTFTDSIIYSTFEQGEPYKFQITEPQNSGDIMSFFVQMSQGDSATVVVVVDSVYRKRLPPFFKAGDKMKYHIRMTKVTGAEEYESAEMEQLKKQLIIDKEILDTYLAENNIDAQEFPNGMRVLIEKEGEGPNLRAGNMVGVHYTGKLLDGTVFDSSIPRGEPFSFAVGQGRVIAGWEEAILLMKQGSKAQIWLPSYLAYGKSRASAEIGPNSILTFEMEVVSVK